MTIDRRQHTRLTDRGSWVGRTTVGVSVALGWFVIVTRVGKVRSSNVDGCRATTSSNPGLRQRSSPLAAT